MEAFEDIIVSVLELGTDYRGLLCKLRQTFTGTGIARVAGGEVNFCDVANIYVCKLLGKCNRSGMSGPLMPVVYCKSLIKPKLRISMS